MDFSVARLWRRQHSVEPPQPLFEEIAHELGALDEAPVAHVFPIDVRVFASRRASDTTLKRSYERISVHDALTMTKIRVMPRAGRARYERGGRYEYRTQCTRVKDLVVSQFELGHYRAREVLPQPSAGSNRVTHDT